MSPPTTSRAPGWLTAPDTRPLLPLDPHPGNCRCRWCADPDEVRDLAQDDARRILGAIW